MVISAADSVPYLESYLRQDMKLSDGEEIPLDWFPKTYKKMQPNTPIVVFAPGCTGTSKDGYSLKFCQKVYKKLGWRTFVVNRRAYLTQLKGNTIIAFGSLADWTEILKSLNQTYP